MTFNCCDNCSRIAEEGDLVWLDSEDFEPFDNDNFNRLKYEIALSKGFCALCESCYLRLCCDKKQKKKLTEKDLIL